jgi:hypothetical protein
MFTKAANDRAAVLHTTIDDQFSSFQFARLCACSRLGRVRKAGAAPEEGTRWLLARKMGAQGRRAAPDFDCLEIVHEQLQPILRTSKFVDGELPAISAYSRSF